MSEPLIRNLHDRDVPAIVEIYNPYIALTTITFEEEAVSTLEMRRRVQQVRDQGLPWLCVEVDNCLAGYAYAARWRERSAYRFTAESTIYLHKDYTGHGIGRILYSALVDKIRNAGMHMVIGVITLPNPASVALHEKLGYKQVAHFSEVGFKFNQWLDVGYWQLAL